MDANTPDYDLTFLNGHCIANISFGTTATSIITHGTNYNAAAQIKDKAIINIESDFDLNGNRSCRKDLVSLLRLILAHCYIDTEYNLHLYFTSGDKLIIYRSNGQFESYSIEYEIDNNKYIII